MVDISSLIWSNEFRWAIAIITYFLFLYLVYFILVNYFTDAGEAHTEDIDIKSEKSKKKRRERRIKSVEQTEDLRFDFLKDDEVNKSLNLEVNAGQNEAKSQKKINQAPDNTNKTEHLRSESLDESSKDLKKNPLSKYSKRMRRRYGGKNEILVIVIPMIIAILVGLLIFFSGSNPDGNMMEGMVDMGAGNNVTSETTEEILSDSGDQLEDTAQSSAMQLLDDTIVLMVIITLGPYGFYVFQQKRKRKIYEHEFARFLFELSELLRGGLDPVAGVMELASSTTLETYTRIEMISPHIDHLAKQLDWGVTFEDGMFEMAENLNSEIIKKYTYLVVQTSRIGGGTGEIILQCSEDMEKALELEREKEANLGEYRTIVYIAQFILLAMLIILQSSLIPALTGMNAMSSGGGADQASSFGALITPVNIDFTTAFFHILMINGFSTGIIGGVMSEGDARQGIKHSVILVAVSYVICLLLLL